MSSPATDPAHPDFKSASGDEGSSQHTAAAAPALVAEKSRGVLQMELLSSRMDTKYHVLLYGAFALLAYVMSLGALPRRLPPCPPPGFYSSLTHFFFRLGQTSTRRARTSPLPPPSRLRLTRRWPPFGSSRASSKPSASLRSPRFDTLCLSTAKILTVTAVQYSDYAGELPMTCRQ